MTDERSLNWGKDFRYQTLKGHTNSGCMCFFISLPSLRHSLLYFIVLKHWRFNPWPVENYWWASNIGCNRFWINRFLKDRGVGIWEAWTYDLEFPKSRCHETPMFLIIESQIQNPKFFVSAYYWVALGTGVKAGEGLGFPHALLWATVGEKLGLMFVTTSASFIHPRSPRLTGG